MMRLEAFLYALDLINSNNTLLYGRRIGARIFDMCRNSNKVLICSVTYLGGTVAVVGPEESSSVHLSSVIHASFSPRTAVVSFGGASESLDDKQQYSNLFHTIPGKVIMVDALTDVASFFNWSYIGVLHSYYNQGNGITSFRSHASKKGICVKFAASLKAVLNDQFFHEILRPLKKDKRIKALFLLLSDIEAKQFFRYISRNYDSYSHLNFIGGQQLGTKLGLLTGNNSIDIGLITVEVESARNHDFENYYLGLRPNSNTRNTYFNRFWEQTFNCSLNKNNNGSKQRCTGSEQLKEGKGFYENAPVSPIINAVLAIVYSLKHVLEKKCFHLSGQNMTACLLTSYPGVYGDSEEVFLPDETPNESVLQQLPSVKIPSASGNAFKFDKNSRPDLKNYNIYNTQLQEGEIRFVNVGLWKDNVSSVRPSLKYKDRLFLNVSLMKWKSSVVPSSQCAEQCSINQVKVYDKVTPCCWKCLTCTENSIIVNNTCERCKSWTRSDTTSSKCLSMPFKSIEVNAVFPMMITILAALFLLITAALISVYIKNFDTHTIRASGRELSLVVIAGLVVIFATPFSFLVRPTTIICNLQQCLFGTSLVLCSAPLFLKSLTLYRIVQNANNSVLAPRLSTRRSQVSICLGLIAIQILLCALWLQGNPGIVQNYSSADKKHVILHCKFDLISLGISFVYPIILMVLGIGFALRTKSKNLPRAVNESKHIALTLVLTCLVLILYLVSFTVYSNDKTTFTLEYSICVIYLIIGAMIVVCIFIPRMHLVFFPVPRVDDTQRLSTIWSCQSTPIQNVRHLSRTVSPCSCSMASPLSHRQDQPNGYKSDGHKLDGQNLDEHKLNEHKSDGHKSEENNRKILYVRSPIPESDIVEEKP
eukprot:Seg1108.5 transcript_id=Seg1108.5/GoldUCD/mRNA.D3Y31 product="Metabotropic glutamate receptor 3" protein_id=Seg1108.5/GoldUCD/D3Y31